MGARDSSEGLRAAGGKGLIRNQAELGRGVCVSLSTVTACARPSRGHLCIFVGVFTHATLTCPRVSPSLSCVPKFHSYVIRHPQWTRVLSRPWAGAGLPAPSNYVDRNGSFKGLCLMP